MSRKKTMTLNLSEKEMAILEEFSAQKGLSKTALLRQALRLYGLVEDRLHSGDKLIFENDKTKKKSELLFL